MLIHETVNLYVYAQLSISPTNGASTHQKSKSQKLHYLVFLSQLQIKASGQACQQLKQSLEESQGRLIVAEQTAQEKTVSEGPPTNCTRGKRENKGPGTKQCSR